jgi:hypothetical protein
MREVPFLGNDMKDQPLPTTGKPLDRADASGKADSEWTEESDQRRPRGSLAINVDDAQLDDSPENKT